MFFFRVRYDKFLILMLLIISFCFVHRKPNLRMWGRLLTRASGWRYFRISYGPRQPPTRSPRVCRWVFISSHLHNKHYNKLRILGTLRDQAILSFLYEFSYEQRMLHWFSILEPGIVFFIFECPFTVLASLPKLNFSSFFFSRSRSWKFWSVIDGRQRLKTQYINVRGKEEVKII